MSDLVTTYRAGVCDLALAGAALAVDDGLETGVVISLLTDRRVAASEAPEGSLRGWWGDSYADAGNDAIGSKLWLLAREKQLPQTLRRAEAYAREALQWLVDDGVAQGVTVSAEWLEPSVMGMLVQVQRSAVPVAQFRFDLFWKGA